MESKQSKFEIVPIAQFKQGLFLKGKKLNEQGTQIKLVDKKSGRDYFKYIYQFELLDCSENLSFSARNEATRGYDEVFPMEHAKVAVWATKSLHEKLGMFPVGTILRIEEMGQEDAGGQFKRRAFSIKMEVK